MVSVVAATLHSLGPGPFLTRNLTGLACREGRLMPPSPHGSAWCADGRLFPRIRFDSLYFHLLVARRILRRLPLVFPRFCGAKQLNSLPHAVGKVECNLDTTRQHKTVHYKLLFGGQSKASLL